MNDFVNIIMISYTEFIAKNRLRNTVQRRVLYELIAKKKEHFSLEKLYSEAKKMFPNIGTATVYRFLKSLTETGQIKEHHFGKETLYEVETKKTHHDHLICITCYRIVEFKNKKIEILQKKIALKNGFTLIDHKLELYGNCNACATLRPIETIRPISQ